MSWINDAGKILMSKGGKLYIQFDKDFEVKKGDTLTIEKYEEYIDSMVDRGVIKEEQGEERKSRTFIKYVLAKPPRKEA